MNRASVQEAPGTTSVDTKRREKRDELLFQPVQLGPYLLPYRIVMAPLTRSRAGQPGNVPTLQNACYYAQRASAALIISEATQVSMQGQGYAWTPGIHSREQIEGWRLVADAVHQAGGRIFMQLWHVGRISHPALQPDRMLPVAPSPVRPSGMAFIENERGEAELVPFVTPRALQTIEMRYVVAQFERAANNAKHAGMDGIEIHAANGYLIDQFIESGTNKRTDAYGGRLDHRMRFLMEVVDIVTKVWGPDFVGVRLSPLSTFNDMRDSDSETTFSRIAERLNPYRLAYLHLVNPAKTALEEGREPDDASLRMLNLIRGDIRANSCWPAVSTATRRRSGWRKDAPISSLSGESSSPIQICLSASARTRPLTPTILKPITAAAPRATRTIRRSRSFAATSPRRVWTKDGDRSVSCQNLPMMPAFTPASLQLRKSLQRCAQPRSTVSAVPRCSSCISFRCRGPTTTTDDCQ